MMEYKRLTERMSDGKGNPNCSECEHNKMCGDEYYCDDGESCYQAIFDRLAELEDKIEQGTLIGLPCKVGDTAYHLTSIHTLEELGVAEIFDGEVTSISKDKDVLWISCHYNNGLNFWYSQREIGRKLFFTREEAEKRLKELQG